MMKGQSWRVAPAWVLCWSLLCLCLLLLRHDGALAARLESLRGESIFERLTALAGVGVDGQFVQMPLNGEQYYLVLTLSRSCRYCQASIANWKTIAARLDKAKWHVVWLTSDVLEDARQFAAEHHVEGTVLAEVPYRVYRQLGLTAVPRTVAVAPDGVVVGSVLGVVDEARVEVIEGLLRRAQEGQ